MEIADEIRSLLFATSKSNTNKKEISLRLAEILVENKNGLLNVIQATIDPEFSSQKLTTHNQRFQAIATIITRMPFLPFSEKVYYENLSQQILVILKLYNENSKDRENEVIDVIWRAAAFIFIAFYDKNSKFGYEYLVKPLINSLKFNESANFTIEESLLIINRLLSCNFYSRKFYECFVYLFSIRVKIERTQSHNKQILNEILFKLLDSNKKTIYLLEDTLCKSLSILDIYQVNIKDNEKLTYVISENKCKNENKQDNTLELIDDIVQNTEKLLLKMEKIYLVDFYLLLLERLLFSTTIMNKILLYSLLDTLQDNVYSAILIFPSKAFHLLSNCIKRASNMSIAFEHSLNVNTEEKTLLDDLAVNSLSICVEILAQLSNSQKKLSVEELGQLKDCLNDLEKLKNHSDPRANLFAQRITESINVLTKQDFTDDNEPDKKEKYDEAIKDLNDDCMPMKAHALITLRHLILCKDKKTMQHKSQLLILFQGCISDKETYIYLAAIKALSALATTSTEETLPVLLEAYLNTDRNLQERTNVGEILVELSKNLGDMAFHYSKEIINTFLIGCKDTEEIIRVSSVSNLGQFCAILRFGLLSFITEIILCMNSLLKTDPSLEVKRSAVMFIHLLLSGIDKNTLKAIETELVSISVLIKHVRNTSIDEILQIHCELVIEQISRIIKEILFTDSPAVKRIQML